MIGRAGLKAGLIGAVAVVVLTLLPSVVFFPCGFFSLPVYGGVGALAAWYLAPPRVPTSAAAAAAIAGAVSAGVSTLALIAAAAAVLGPYPEILREPINIAPALSVPTWVGLVVAMGAGALVNLGMGAGLGAVGGVVLAAVTASPKH